MPCVSVIDIHLGAYLFFRNISLSWFLLIRYLRAKATCHLDATSWLDVGKTNTTTETQVVIICSQGRREKQQQQQRNIRLLLVKKFQMELLFPTGALY